MQEGHPYLTEELDRQRAEQRRFLRSIPDWILEEGRLGPGMKAKDNIPDGPFVETLLRRCASSLIEQLKEPLGIWESDMEEDRLDSFVRTEVTAKPRARTDQVWNTFVREVATKAQKKVQEPRKFDEKLVPDVALVVQLLSLAEDLADDGYRDSRLAP